MDNAHKVFVVGFTVLVAGITSSPEVHNVSSSGKIDIFLWKLDQSIFIDTSYY